MKAAAVIAACALVASPALAAQKTSIKLVDLRSRFFKEHSNRNGPEVTMNTPSSIDDKTDMVCVGYYGAGHAEVRLMADAASQPLVVTPRISIAIMAAMKSGVDDNANDERISICRVFVPRSEVDERAVESADEVEEEEATVKPTTGGWKTWFSRPTKQPIKVIAPEHMTTTSWRRPFASFSKTPLYVQLPADMQNKVVTLCEDIPAKYTRNLSRQLKWWSFRVGTGMGSFWSMLVRSYKSHSIINDIKTFDLSAYINDETSVSSHVEYSQSNVDEQSEGEEEEEEDEDQDDSSSESGSESGDERGLEFEEDVTIEHHYDW